MPALGPSWKLGMLGISVATLLAAVSLPATSPTGNTGAPRPADHPVAALAWVRANCDAGLAMKPGAHLEHAEVLMRVAAELDQARTEAPIEDVCREAIAAAKPAIARRSAKAAQKTAANDR